jgi:hypothetical protein
MFRFLLSSYITEGGVNFRKLIFFGEGNCNFKKKNIKILALSASKELTPTPAIFSPVSINSPGTVDNS